MVTPGQGAPSQATRQGHVDAAFVTEGCQVTDPELGTLV